MKKNYPETRAAIRKVLFSCLKEGGQIIHNGFGAVHSIRKKGPVSLVTEVDTTAERKIVSIIKKYFPAHQMMMEESAPIVSNSAYRWIIDPLDGTTNFLHQIPLCCVSIGIEFEGKLILGGIFNPLLKELFFAERGKGAFLNGKKIRVSKTKKLIDSLLVTGFPYDRQEKAAYYLKFFKVAMEKCQGIRRLGAAALDLSYVACGKFDAFWEFNLKAWDIAAGILIVKEAGGKITDFSNKPLNIDRPEQLLASNNKIHSALLRNFNF